MITEKLDFETIFNATPGLYLILSLDLKIVAVNEAYLRATMTEREQILGRYLFEVFPDNPQDPTATGVGNLRASLERVLKHKVPDTMAVQKYDIRRPKSEGGGFEERYWSPVNSPVFKKGSQEILYIIHRVQDVTDFVQLKNSGDEKNRMVQEDILLRSQELLKANKKLWQAETLLRNSYAELESRVEERTQELKKTQQHLIQQERLRALGQMASGIAHDFNNALSPILGYSELLLTNETKFDETKRSEFLNIILTSARDAAQMVRRLRYFGKARESEEPFTLIGINALIEQVIELTKPKWKAQAMSRSVDISIGKDLKEIPYVMGNEQQLREALTNLVFNAVDAMPKSGSMIFRTYEKEGRVSIELMDSGLGMTEEVRLKCLEPFFTTKGEKGTGLGLSLVYGIIQSHGGTLQIKSELGKGTTFILSLPVFLLAKDGGVETKIQNSVRPLRILYLEDESDVQKVTLEYLKLDGHSVVVASNGYDGLQKFYAGKNDFDVIITDNGMPQMNGKEVARLVRKLSPHQKIIHLTGAPEVETEPLAPFFNASLAKPVAVEELRRALHKLFPN